MNDLLNFKEDILNDCELNPNVTHATFIDLEKACDTVSLDAILQKGENCGLRGPTQALLKSYLTNRYQLLKISCKKLKLKAIHCGAPQGSILGPLLFILMINDLPTISSSVNTKLYADDTALKQKEQNLQQYNEDLSKTRIWLKMNKLNLNLDKITNINFNRKKILNRQYKVGTDNVKKGFHTKHLGIYADSKLDLIFHIDFLVEKMIMFCWLLYRLPDVLPTSQLIKIYFSHIQPIL